jgi:uncharacterized repeat protein (TIGR03803 family)
MNTDGSGFSVLYSFAGGTDGQHPTAGLILVGSTLYGTASGGGANGNGTIFQINTDGTGFSVIHQFAGGSDGVEPYADLMLSGSMLYGTTELGGSFGGGTVFAIVVPEPSALVMAAIAGLLGIAGRAIYRRHNAGL